MPVVHVVDDDENVAVVVLVEDDKVDDGDDSVVSLLVCVRNFASRVFSSLGTCTIEQGDGGKPSASAQLGVIHGNIRD